MAEIAQPEGAEPKKKRGGMLLIGIAGAVLLGGGAFYATYSGLLLGESKHAATEDDHGSSESKTHTPARDFTFIPLKPIIVSLGPRAQAGHLRFEGTLEVNPAHAEEVELLMPRILDVLNSYLRALSEEELANPAAMIRIQAQMLHRIELVTGSDHVRDLLVTELILN